MGGIREESFIGRCSLLTAFVTSRRPPSPLRCGKERDERPKDEARHRWDERRTMYPENVNARNHILARIVARKNVSWQ